MWTGRNSCNKNTTQGGILRQEIRIYKRVNLRHTDIRTYNIWTMKFQVILPSETWKIWWPSRCKRWERAYQNFIFLQKNLSDPNSNVKKNWITRHSGRMNHFRYLTFFQENHSSQLDVCTALSYYINILCQEITSAIKQWKRIFLSENRIMKLHTDSYFNFHISQLYHYLR
jgi:hypothetical protein